MPRAESCWGHLEVLGRRLLEEACVDEADSEHLRWRQGVIGDRPSPLEVVLHFAIFLDGPQLQVWYLSLLDTLQSAAGKSDFPAPCWKITVPAHSCRATLLRFHVVETASPGHVRHWAGLHVSGARSFLHCSPVPVDTTCSGQTAAARRLARGDCLDRSLGFHLVHARSPFGRVECLFHCNGPRQGCHGARQLLSLPAEGLYLAADSKGSLVCLRHAPIIHWPTTTRLDTLVNASAFPVGLVCSLPPARARLSVGRRGHDHMSDAAGHSFCHTLHSEWRSSLPAADTTTGGSCAGAWPPGAFCHFTFNRVQCPKVPQDPGFEPDLMTTQRRPANRVGGQQCQHPTWSQPHQAVLCRGRLCASCVTQAAPTETAQLRATHGTIAHASTPEHCEQATQGHWTKSANKATAKLNTGGARNSCRDNSRCIPHYTRRRRQPGFRENIMWTARCLWRPALSTFAFSRVCLWDYGLPIMRWNPGRPQLCSAETAHLKSGAAACQSGTQAGSTAVDWFATHPRGRQMLTHHNEVAEGFSSSGTCSGTSSGPESGARWARGRTPESGVTKRHSYSQDTACAAQRCAPSQRWSQFVRESRMGSAWPLTQLPVVALQLSQSQSFVHVCCNHAIAGLGDPIALLQTAQRRSGAGPEGQVGGMPPKPFKSKCTMARQGQRLGKRQRDEAREQRAMSQHDKPPLPKDALVRTASHHVPGTGTARPSTCGPLPLVPPGAQAELAPAQPKLLAYCQGHKWQGSTQAMSSPCAGPVPLAPGSMMAAPMGSPTVATLGLQPAALTLTHIQRPDAETPIGSAWMDPVSAAASSGDQTTTPEAEPVVRLSERPAQACKDEDTSDRSSSSSELVPDHVQAAARVPPPPPPPRRKRASCSLSERVAHRAKKPSVSMGGASSSSNSMVDLAERVDADAAESDGSDGTTSTELRAATDSSGSEEDSPSTGQPQSNLAELRSKLLAVFARSRVRAKLAIITTARISSEWMWHFSHRLMPCRACVCPGSQVVCVTTPATAGRAYHQGFTDSGRDTSICLSNQQLGLCQASPREEPGSL